MHGQSPASPEGGRYLSRVGGGVVALGQTGERHPWISFASTVSKGQCERVAMASAGVGMCCRLRRRALTFSSGAGSKICIQPEKGPRLVAAA